MPKYIHRRYDWSPRVYIEPLLPTFLLIGTSGTLHGVPTGNSSKGPIQKRAGGWPERNPMANQFQPAGRNSMVPGRFPVLSTHRQDEERPGERIREYVTFNSLHRPPLRVPSRASLR